MRRLLTGIVMLMFVFPAAVFAASSLQAQKELDELTSMMNQKNYSHEKRIQYYQSFIDDYKGTRAAKEAEKLITEEQKKAEVERSQNDSIERKKKEASRLGYIEDPEAGLQWVPAPSRDMNWDEADAYVRSLSVAGGGWRLATMEELRSLYRRLSSFGGKEVFINSGWWVWSSELKVGDPSLAWGIGFGNGSESAIHRTYSVGNNRYLAVRSRR